MTFSREDPVLTQRVCHHDVRLPLSGYLRTLGLGYEPKSLLDARAVLALLRVNADQGRLGGLLKLALTKGGGASRDDLASLLAQLRRDQARLESLLDEFEAGS